MRAKGFKRENSIRNFGEEIGYTQGVGIAWSVDFDRFGELIDIILKGKKKVEAEKAKEAEAAAEENDKDLPGFVGFKKEKEED